MSILKLFHVLFVFIWIGSLLALSRLMAYQSREKAQIQLSLARIYKRMYFFIDLPSMILAVVFGIILLSLKEMDWKAAWLHVKLTFAFFLIICDVFCGILLVRMAEKPVKGRGIAYKIFHGVIGLCLIVVLVAIYVIKNAS